MDSESDEELPSLAALVTRIKQNRPTPTTVRKHQSPIQDPAEEAIVSKAKDKSRSSRLQPISRSSSSSSVDNATPSKSKGKTVRGGASLSKQIHRSMSNSTLDVTTNTQETSRTFSSINDNLTGTKEYLHSKRAQPLPTDLQQAGLCPPITVPWPLPSGSSTSRETESSLFVIDLASTESAYAYQGGDNISVAASTSLLPSDAVNSNKGAKGNDASATSLTSSTKDARKKRRVTIITISDSEDDEIAPPLPSHRRSPSRTPSLVIEDHSEEQDELAEEVSFADYSDRECSEPEGTVKKPAAASQVIEIDSSDSEYDTAAGVISWDPTPNKLKHIAKPSNVTAPAVRTDGPNTAVNPDRLLAPITPARTKVNRNNSGEGFTTGKKTPRINASAEPITAAKARPTRKNSAFAKQRDELAMQLINELNTTVFKGQLPDDLTVVWNGRLNTTAGRANWKKVTQRSTNTTAYKAEIELSVKVVDSEEKLKCTLSHELCHVAAWAIDKEMKPAHGAAFKNWGNKIMRCRSDIKVTTKHTYEIAYKYQWQCKNPVCQKIYGRHSKSVDPTRHACGVCSGKLVRLDKNGLPVVEAEGVAGTPRKESEWAVFSKVAFKRIKQEQPSLTMTQVNKIVAAEWAELKAKKASQSSAIQLLAQELEALAVTPAA